MSSWTEKIFDYEFLRTFVRSPQAKKAAFLWGLCEATFFFIVPDVFFCFTALIFPLFGFIHGLISVLGSLVGGLVMYMLTIFFPGAMNTFLLIIPGIPEGMVQNVFVDLQTTGWVALLKAPLGGIPYKIYAVQASTLNMSLLGFLLMTIPARLERILVVSGIACIFGKVFEKGIAKHTKAWVSGYVLFWIGFYILYSYLITVKY